MYNFFGRGEGSEVPRALALSKPLSWGLEVPGLGWLRKWGALELCGEDAIRAAGQGRAWSTRQPAPFLHIQGPQNVFLLSSGGDSTPGVSEERNWGRPPRMGGFGLRPPGGLVTEPCRVLQGPSRGRASFPGACASLWTL